MTWMPIVGCLLSFVSIILLVGAVVTYLKQRKNFAGRISTTGTVVSLQIHAASTLEQGSGAMYYPVVEFVTNSNETVQFESDFGSMPAGYHVGQNVKVAYSLNNPGKAEIDSMLSRYLTALVLGFMGIISMCLGLSFLIIGLLVTLPQK